MLPGRPAALAALMRNFPMEFFFKALLEYHIYESCLRLWFTARNNGDSGLLASSGR